MSDERHVWIVIVVVTILASVPATLMAAAEPGPLRAGAAAVDITPTELPVKVVGGFLERTSAKIVDRLHARAIVLDDGRTRLAITVVDSCLIDRAVYDEAKTIANRSTGIPADRMLMAATHTHSAPATVGALGTDVEENYRRGLPALIARAVEAAAANLAPARIGWSVGRLTDYTHCRRWIRRPDCIGKDPFGHLTVRAMMHPGPQNPEYLGVAGPADPDLSIVSVQSADGEPLALFANYAMHYVGAEPISADYFGTFAERIGQAIGARERTPRFVGILSNGTSGDLWYMDYSKPRRNHDLNSFATILIDAVAAAYPKIVHRDRVDLAMAETTLPLEIRPISDADLAAAKQRYAEFADRKPRSIDEVYARDQVLLDQLPSTHRLTLQALRIGDCGIAAIPCEVFALTGLKIKAASPLRPTFIIELANGYDGYLPTPEQHVLGGYETWRARSSCLDKQAEPKIVAAVRGLLERVSGQPSRELTSADFPFADYPRAVLASRPVAYWRLNETAGPTAVDASGNKRDATFEGGWA
ncbi:MAG: hypothetical protein HY718_10890, partial [Planctomycetes bacterium]|nr:hypothetical protein [Planctomycetota bacterium]